MKVMAIMSYVSVEIVVTDLENIQDQLQHVQVGIEDRNFGQALRLYYHPFTFGQVSLPFLNNFHCYKGRIFWCFSSSRSAFQNI